MKTFPIKLNDDFWLTLSEAAHAARKSLHQYILDALIAAVNGGRA